MTELKCMTLDGKALRRAGLRMMLVLLSGLMLTACDKCGNSIFHADASGPLVCREQSPR